MSADIVPFRPKPRRQPTQAELVERVHGFAKQGRIGFSHPHVRNKMIQRGITMRQILEVARKGEAVSGPTLDEWGDWRIKLRRKVAGRRVQIVTAVKADLFIVVTVI